MTGSLRSTARNPVAIALMGLLILVFLVLGVGGGGRFPDAFRAAAADSVVTAGSHSMSSRDFLRVFDQQKEKYEQQAGQTFTTDFLVQNGADQQMLGEIALEQAELEMVTRAGITPAPVLVDAEIKKLPFAFDRVTGQFSQQQFTQALAAQGFTPKQAEAQIADELAQRHFTYAMQAGFKVPRLYAALSAVAGMESRDVSWFLLDLHAVPPPAPPTDAQLLAFMQAHAAQLTRPEMRVISLARFSAKALAPTITVDPAEVAKEFAFKKDTLSNPERRTVIEIPVKTVADGATAAQRLSRGEEPAAIAKSMGVEPVIYLDKPQSAIADRKLGAAAFALKDGAVGGPVAGDLGLAAVKIAKVTPGGAATLETARAKIEADLRDRKAADLAYKQSQAFDDARQAGAGVADAARKAGVALLTVGPVTATGLDDSGKPNPALSDKILKAAFALGAGQDGDLEDAGAGEYFAVRVERVQPPSLPALADKRPQLAQAYMTQELVTALKAKALSLVDQIRKGQGIDQVAAQVGAHVTRQPGMQRLQAQQYQALGREFLENVFGLKPGDAFAAGGGNGIYIGRLDAARPGDTVATARLLEAIRGRVTQGYVSEMIGEVREASRRSIKTDVNLAVARRAIGVDPATTAKSGVKPGGQAK